MNSNAEKHLRQNPLQRFLIDNFHHHIKALLEPLHPATLFDAGCGEGFTLKTLALPRQIGLDYSVNALQYAHHEQGLQNTSLLQGSLYEIPFATNSFEVVICLEVLEHLENPPEALQELLRVSSRYVIASVPHEPFFRGVQLLRGRYLEHWGNHPEHIQQFSHGSFRHMVESSGATLHEHRFSFPWQIVLLEK